MCHPHAICTLEYFPNHYWSALLQPLPSLPVKLMDAKSRWRKKWLLPGWSTNQISDKNHFGMIERSWNQGEKCVCLVSECPTHWPWCSFLLPLSQPFMPILLPSGHTLHFMPFTPVLQEHRPDICSQSSRTEPVASQLHAAVERWKKNERDWWGGKKASQLATTAGREIGIARFIVCTNCAWSNLSLCSVVLERHLCLKYQGLVIVQPALGATGGGQEGGEWVRKRNSGKQRRGRTSSPLCSGNQWRVLFSTPLLLNVVLACGVLSACFG